MVKPSWILSACSLISLCSVSCFATGSGAEFLPLHGMWGWSVYLGAMGRRKTRVQGCQEEKCVCVACEETSSVCASPPGIVGLLLAALPWIITSQMGTSCPEKEGDTLQPSVLLLSRSEAADY